MKIIRNYIILSVLFLTLALQSCQQAGGNSTGSEYMPDMGHSIAYEANYYNYYYHNTWGSEDEYYEYAQPKLPVNGTVPRTISRNFPIPTQGSHPYYYGDNEEDRAKAMAEIIENPLPITDAGIEEGKAMYEIYCATCHGEKADGNGYLVRDDGGKYPVQPANFLLEEHVNASNGRYYHAIMHGRNLMGSYKDKVSYEERWNVIHYIRSLQAKELKLTYNQLENTLNSVDQPAGPNYMADNSMMDEEVSEDHQEEGMHHDAETHGEDTHMNEDAHTDEHSDESHGH